MSYSRYERLANKAFESGNITLFREYIQKMIECELEQKEDERDNDDEDT